MLKLKLIFTLLIVSFLGYSQQVVKYKSKATDKKEFVETSDHIKTGIAIKVDPLTSILGEIPFLVEVKLSDQFSVEAGVTYVYNDLTTDLGTFKDEYDDSYILQPTIGGIINGRYYFDEPFSSRSAFIGIMYKYKRMERKREEPLPGTSETLLYDNFNIFTFIWGDQHVFNKTWILEYYVGVGYRHTKIQRYSGDEWQGYKPYEKNPNFLDDGYTPMSLQVGARIGYIIH